MKAARLNTGRIMGALIVYTALYALLARLGDLGDGVRGFLCLGGVVPGAVFASALAWRAHRHGKRAGEPRARGWAFIAAGSALYAAGALSLLALIFVLH